MMLLIASHVPIGVAMALVGVTGFASIVGWGPALSLMATEPASSMANLDLAVIPLFILMGSLAAASGLASDVYNLANAFVGHRRGGLASTTIMASAGFGAICGSGVATTATFGRVAMPEMLRRGYGADLTSGSIAAGGTLGIIVPPSSIMILYAVLTEQSVLDLFAAAIVPAVMAIVLFMVAIQVKLILDPGAAQRGRKLSMSERAAAVGRGWGVLTLFVTVMGGIYSGIFTVQEGAAVGVVIAFLLLILKRRLTWKTLIGVLAEASAGTAMVYIMVFGATIFSYFMAVTGATSFIVESISDLPIPPIAVLFLLLLVYIFMGAFFDEVAAMVITLPLVIPLIQSFGYDLVWWGIVNVVVIGIGMMTPPIGINVMVLNSMYKEIGLRTLYRGVTPFVIAEIIRLVLLTVFPQITLWLPSVLG